jgi:hypothetical protein
VTPSEVRPRLAEVAAANLSELERVLVETATGVGCKIGRFERADASFWTPHLKSTRENADPEPHRGCGVPKLWSHA